MDLGLDGKVAIVTGAGRGLGRAAAEALVGEGVKVLAVARSVDQLESLRAVAPERIEVAPCDLSRHDQVAGLAGLAIERLGGLDIVVNNAGIAPAEPLLEQDWESWNRVLAVNVTAPAVLAAAAGPHFVAQGSGKIINVVSTAGLRGKPGLVAYSTSKAALIRQTEALAAEWARHNIQVNAIAPGAFKTDAQSAVLESSELLAQRTRRIPAKRMAESDEFGPLVCMVASPLNDFMTGATVVIDGGEVAKL
jgi:2-dehydro-3-deoxy-D-gluconate 5-dehydrogenase